MELHENTFLNNSAKEGGALNTICDFLHNCSYEIRKNEFELNRAHELGGGAIFWNNAEPYISDN